MKEKVPFFRQKSTWGGIISLVGVAAGYATGEIAMETAISAAIPCVLAIIFPEKKTKVEAGV